MKYQRGITLTGLLTGGAILFVVALLGMKVTPAWIEYGKIKQAVEELKDKLQTQLDKLPKLNLSALRSDA